VRSLLEFLKQDSIDKDTALVRSMWHDYGSLKKEYAQSLDDSLSVGAIAFDTALVQWEFGKGIQISREVVHLVQEIKNGKLDPIQF
jgi:hypothetical protein